MGKAAAVAAVPAAEEQLVVAGTATGKPIPEPVIRAEGSVRTES